MSINERDIMGGLAKGLAVIETFTSETPRQSISDAAKAAGLDRATTRRCLLTLAHAGYAEYDGKYFTLTPRVLRLGTACLATMPLPQIVQPHLDRLSDQIGESSSVSILDGDEIVYIARANQRKVMSIALMPGTRLPAFCTSMGRVMLAALPEAEAQRRLEGRSLRGRTVYTKIDSAEVMAELTRVRAQGFALIDQEVELGLRSLAVPLTSARGRVVAALNIGLSTMAAELETMEKRFLPALLAVQSQIRGLLA